MITGLNIPVIYVRLNDCTCVYVLSSIKDIVRI